MKQECGRQNKDSFKSHVGAIIVKLWGTCRRWKENQEWDVCYMQQSNKRSFQ